MCKDNFMFFPILGGIRKKIQRKIILSQHKKNGLFLEIVFHYFFFFFFLDNNFITQQAK